MRQSRTVSVFLVTCICFLLRHKKCFSKQFYCSIFFFSWVCFYELKTMILHLQWDLSVFRSTQQQHGRGLTWCIGYVRTSFYPVHLLPLCLQDRERERERVTEPVAKLICLSGTVSIVLFVLFFFQAVAYKKG